jgi:hypothetical protein
MYLIPNVTEVKPNSVYNIKVQLDSNAVEYTTISIIIKSQNIVTVKNVSIAPNSSSTTFTIFTPQQSGFEKVQIGATYGSNYSQVTLLEASSKNVVMSSNTTEIVGGNTFTVTLTLDAPAVGNQVISLEEINSTENPKVLTVPSLATVTNGNISVNVSINTKTVVKNTLTYIQYKYRGISYNFPIYILK